jgi:hypothetical protein
MDKNIAEIFPKDSMKVKESLNSKMEFKIHLNIIEKSREKVN